MLNPGQIEDNILLKLPADLAVKFRAKLKNKSLSKFTIVPDENSMDHQKVVRKFSIEMIDFPPLKGTLVDLPCMVELQKTNDKEYYYKTGDVGQIMVVELKDDETPLREKMEFAKNPAGLDRLNYQVDSGLTAPSYGIRKRWDLERAVCVCENQEGDICSVCGALPKKHVKVASQKLLNMMIARPTENFRIIEKDIDTTQSMVRVSNGTPASLSVRQTPLVSRTPILGMGASPHSLPRNVSSQPRVAPTMPSQVLKPTVQKLIQKPKAPTVNDAARADVMQKIRTYRDAQIKLAQKQQELNVARKRQDIPADKRAFFEKQYQECIKKGFQCKSKIFELEKKLGKV